MENEIFTPKEVEDMIKEVTSKVVIAAFNAVKYEIMQEYEREKDEDFKWATGLKHSISIIDRCLTQGEKQ